MIRLPWNVSNTLPEAIDEEPCLHVDSGLEMLVTEGEPKRRSLALDRAVIVLGRAEKRGETRAGAILFDNSTVSRRHGVLCWDNKRACYQLYPVSDSANALLCDDEPVAAGGCRLALGKTYRIGHLAFQVRPQRQQSNPPATFVRQALQFFSARGPSPMACTVTAGPGSGNSFLLHPEYQVLYHADTSRTAWSPQRTTSQEAAVLVRVLAHDTYAIWRNPASTVTPRVLRGGAVLHVADGEPVMLEEDDIIALGDLRLCFHRQVQKLVEAELQRALERHAEGVGGTQRVERAQKTRSLTLAEAA